MAGVADIMIGWFKYRLGEAPAIVESGKAAMHHVVGISTVFERPWAVPCTNPTTGNSWVVHEDCEIVYRRKRGVTASHATSIVLSWQYKASVFHPLKSDDALCVSYVIIGSDNGMPSGQYQAVTWTIDNLLSDGPPEIHFSVFVLF